MSMMDVMYEILEKEFINEFFEEYHRPPTREEIDFYFDNTQIDVNEILEKAN